VRRGTPFPSVDTGTSLDHGLVEEDVQLELVSEMSEGGVIFADGIESDRVEFITGQRVTIAIAALRLNLVRPVMQREARHEIPSPPAPRRNTQRGGRAR
jgi:hypothetical protein